jgi:hypothetical protein
MVVAFVTIILDGHFLSSLLVAYDKHHVSKEVKKEL